MRIVGAEKAPACLQEREKGRAASCSVGMGEVLSRGLQFVHACAAMAAGWAMLSKAARIGPPPSSTCHLLAEDAKVGDALHTRRTAGVATIKQLPIDKSCAYSRERAKRREAAPVPAHRFLLLHSPVSLMAAAWVHMPPDQLLSAATRYSNRLAMYIWPSWIVCFGWLRNNVPQQKPMMALCSLWHVRGAGGCEIHLSATIPADSCTAATRAQKPAHRTDSADPCCPALPSLSPSLQSMPTHKRITTYRGLRPCMRNPRDSTAPAMPAAERPYLRLGRVGRFVSNHCPQLASKHGIKWRRGSDMQAVD